MSSQSLPKNKDGWSSRTDKTGKCKSILMFYLFRILDLKGDLGTLILSDLH